MSNLAQVPSKAFTDAAKYADEIDNLSMDQENRTKALRIELANVAASFMRSAAKEIDDLAARRFASLTSPETKQRAVKDVGKILYGWGDDEPNPATGHLLIVEAEAVVEAVLRSVEEGTQ